MLVKSPLTSVRWHSVGLIMKARATPTDLHDFITARDRLFFFLLFFSPAGAAHENGAVGRKRQGDRDAGGKAGVFSAARSSQSSQEVLTWTVYVVISRCAWLIDTLIFISFLLVCTNSFFFAKVASQMSHSPAPLSSIRNHFSA